MNAWTPWPSGCNGLKLRNRFLKLGMHRQQLLQLHLQRCLMSLTFQQTLLSKIADAQP
jgi:hypothetical protein